jgi:20S proteasome alpha/beta subunit
MITNQDNNKQTKVQISLYASRLKNVAGTLKGTSDPYAVVTLLAGSTHEKPEVLGKTEV